MVIVFSENLCVGWGQKHWLVGWFSGWLNEQIDRRGVCFRAIFAEKSVRSIISIETVSTAAAEHAAITGSASNGVGATAAQQDVRIGDAIDQVSTTITSDRVISGLTGQRIRLRPDSVT